MNKLQYIKKLDSDNNLPEMHSVEFSNTGVYWGKVSKKTNENVKELCLKAKNNKSMAETLAGHLSIQVEASEEINSVILPIMFGMANKAVEALPGNKEWQCMGSWVNFQKKYEFNPFHRHSGLFSFVYWAQIPYNIKDEMDLDITKNSTMPTASCFSLYYATLLGEMQIRPFHLDKNDEGMFVLFPSKMNHSVHPFYTSDDERISISGNIRFSLKDDPSVIPEIFM